MSFVLSVQPAILPPRIFLHKFYQTPFFYKGCLFIFYFLSHNLFIRIHFITKLSVKFSHYYFYYLYLFYYFIICKYFFYIKGRNNII